MIIDSIKLGIMALVFSSVLGVGYLGYSKVKHIGYEEAKVEYEAKYKEYVEAHQEKLNSIVKISDALLIESRANNEKTMEGLTKILTKSKGKPLVIIKDGVCSPTLTFTNSLSEMNKQVNESLKGKLK